MGFRDSLNNNPDDDLNRFDQAGGDDLANFDDASGETSIPAGTYTATIFRGELVTTKKGKTAYRLTFDISDGPHAGFRVWRYYMFDSKPAANRSKFALAPLKLQTSADLRELFPGAGRVVTVRLLVGVQTMTDGTKSNDVERFEVVNDRIDPPNPNAVNPADFTPPEGGSQ
jgi:hypothetical protein